MTSVGRMHYSNLTTTSKTMELITHLYACWGAALHQNCADADAEADADPDAVVGADAKAFPQTRLVVRF